MKNIIAPIERKILETELTEEKFLRNKMKRLAEQMKRLAEQKKTCLHGRKKKERNLQTDEPYKM